MSKDTEKIINNTKIKICGLIREEDIEVVNRFLPEYIGFVFWPRSKRFVDRDKAAALKEKLDKRIEAVGVFVDEDIEVVAGLLKDGIIDIAQLHGSETEDYIKELKRLTGKGVIKAFKVPRVNDDPIEAGRVANDDVSSDVMQKELRMRINTSPADHILLDSGMGSGKTFDWSSIGDFGRPYFLAGGLDTENVREAVEKLRPYAVDVSSGVETDGRKDAKKIKIFIESVRWRREE
ncbi:MAG TPA: N-(5'-phosphoribosyl)anthranilate isomerase [Lachnospiraceae bacterium]|nr:N-(5'-phosphoribosyl)anthranilate isomerase [Lachnospiraceae bacterium]